MLCGRFYCFKNIYVLSVITKKEEIADLLDDIRAGVHFIRKHKSETIYQAFIGQTLSEEIHNNKDHNVREKAHEQLRELINQYDTRQEANILENNRLDGVDWQKAYHQWIIPHMTEILKINGENLGFKVPLIFTQALKEI